MSADNFDRSLKLVLIDEGGNDDDPHDHGGRTSRGITQREYDRYCADNELPSSDVWSAPDAVVRAIYYDDYWQPHCDDLPSGVDYVFFDTAVNAGRRQAIKTIQRVVPTLADGIWGPMTEIAIASRAPADIVADMCMTRRDFYRGLAQFPRYGKGWLRRVDHCETEAMKMVKQEATS